jgi:dienelactone hydrolase
VELLEHEELNEAGAALERLRELPEVDSKRIAVVGHSFGGALSLLQAAREPAIRVVVSFSGAAGSWDQSSALRQDLLAAVAQMSAAALFIHAQNDYSTASGPALAAEIKRLGKANELRIYPPFGADARAGHNLVFRSVATWESDVFAFLDAYLSVLPQRSNRIDSPRTQRRH